MGSSGIDILKTSASRFGGDDASTHAAAIAYSAVFAIAPLLIVAIGIAGDVLGIARGGHQHHVVENQLIGALASSAGTQTAQSVRAIVDTSFASHQGSIIAQILGWITFALAASGFFLSVQNALNKVWHADPHGNGFLLTLRNRMASAVMLLLIAVAVFASIALNVALSFFWNHLIAVIPIPGAGIVLTVVNWLLSIAILACVFAALYKVLPDTEIHWNDVWVGAIATAVLFVVGETLLSVYLGHAGLSSGYGAAGSLVILLVWVYYSAMLLLFGAELTRAYSEVHGSRAGSRVQTQTQTRAAGDRRGERVEHMR